MTNGTIRDEKGRIIYPVVVTFTESDKTGNEIVSQEVAFTYSKNFITTSSVAYDGQSKVFVRLGNIIGGGVEYTYKSERPVSVSASVNTIT